MILSLELKDNSVHMYKEWHRDRGEPTEFVLPIQIRYAREIWMNARTTQNDKNIYVCLLFNGSVTRHWDAV